MKRIIAFLVIAVLMLSGFAFAEEGAEKKAELIFQNLNVLYEEGLTYLKQMKEVWKSFVLEGKTSIDKDWFDKNILETGMPSGRHGEILVWAIHNGYTLADINNAYDLFYLPLEARTQSARDACLVFIQLVYRDPQAAEKLKPFKDQIIALKDEKPDYEYMKELQNFYRKTSELIDYAGGDYEDYDSFSRKVSEFEETRVSIRSDFIFAYDWIDWNYLPRTLDEEYKSYFSSYEKPEDKAKQPIYAEAEKLWQEGKKAEANGLYAMLGNYKDSAEKFDAHYCTKTISTILRSGLAPVKYGDYYVFLTKEGKSKFALELDYVDSASGGLFPAMKDKKRGYINTEGEIVIPFTWDVAQQFSKEGKAFVYSEKDGYWSEIDKTGQVLRDRLGNPTTLLEDQEDGVWIPFRSWYSDNTGKQVLTGDWDNGNDFYGDYAVVSKDKKYGLIDRKGTYIIPCEYDSILNGGTYFVLIKDNYLTIQDTAGNVLF